MSTTPVPEPLMPYAGLVDDAAIFPPGNAPVPEAVRGHAEHRGAWYAALVGGFVCADTRLTELQAALDDTRDDVPRPLRLNLTVIGGAGAIEPALTWVGRDERLGLDVLEVALRDEDDLARNATRMSTVLGNALPEGVDAYVEMPRLHGADISASWASALDELAAAGLRLKYRTGGAEHEAFPSCAELAAVIAAALDREVEFKLTAGLHHAVRHTAGDTGFEHHGFLNVLLATRASLDGAAEADAAVLLDERDPAAVAKQVADLGAAGVSSTRRWFTSFGSCSVIEPVGDLVELGLVGEGRTT
ncbi:MAG: hypothetical protein M3165_07095 [Actinomycetota bacterium]|nr:hypothetical protein [Actinomycetota bacterium]